MPCLVLLSCLTLTVASRAFKRCISFWMVDQMVKEECGRLVYKISWIASSKALSFPSGSVCFYLYSILPLLVSSCMTYDDPQMLNRLQKSNHALWPLSETFFFYVLPIPPWGNCNRMSWHDDHVCKSLSSLRIHHEYIL